MAKTVMSIKQHEQIVAELNTKINDLGKMQIKDTNTIRGLQIELTHLKESKAELQSAKDDLYVAYCRITRKHWWQFWKPKFFPFK